MDGKNLNVLKKRVRGMIKSAYGSQRNFPRLYCRKRFFFLDFSMLFFFEAACKFIYFLFDTGKEGMKKDREGYAYTEYSEEEGEIAESGKDVYHIVCDYRQNDVQIYACYAYNRYSRGD